MRDMYLNPKKDEVLANNKDSKKDDECRVRRNHFLQVFFERLRVGLPSFRGVHEKPAPGQRPQSYSQCNGPRPLCLLSMLPKIMRHPSCGLHKRGRASA